MVDYYDDDVGAVGAFVNATIRAATGGDWNQREKDNHMLISNYIKRRENHGHLFYSP